MERDIRGEVIAQMNATLAQRGRPKLTPRQEHLVREFVNDEGRVEKADDAALLQQLLASNSA